jgi:restriction system protein
MLTDEYRVRSPLYPEYSEVRHLLKLWDGVEKSEILGMIQAIHDQTGTPQDPLDWTEPDVWIEARLDGRSRDLARAIWDKSGHEVNPRYAYGSYLFINSYDLLIEKLEGTYQLGPNGEAFLAEKEDLIRRIDFIEGVDELLSILATKTRAMRGDLLPEWSDFLKDFSKFGTTSTTKDTLRRRLVNLTERGFVERDGNYYVITQEGIDYAASFAQSGQTDPERDVTRAIAEYNRSQREAVRRRLSEMSPTAFERLARDLLEEMGYEDVQVTKQSGDKGVDVVATVRFGITSVREVVQVKRYTSNIGRPVLDQLRGALPYHDAIQGTIITLGSFTKGCKEAAIFRGAAPITLIDGDRLLELMEEHEVGVVKKPAKLFAPDESYFEDGGDADPSAAEI